MENKLFELAAKRRSVRSYTDEHISEDVINEIMKVALVAPCSFGHRPVEFVVVRNEEIRELLDVPDGYAVLNLIALGGKGENKQGYTESDFDFGKVHYERF